MNADIIKWKQVHRFICVFLLYHVVEYYIYHVNMMKSGENSNKCTLNIWFNLKRLSNTIDELNTRQKR